METATSSSQADDAPNTGNIPIGADSSSSSRDRSATTTHWVSRREVVREGDRRGDRPRFGAACRVALAAVRCARGSGITEEELTGDFFYSKAGESWTWKTGGKEIFTYYDFSL